MAPLERWIFLFCIFHVKNELIPMKLLYNFREIPVLQKGPK